MLRKSKVFCFDKCYHLELSIVVRFAQRIGIIVFRSLPCKSKESAALSIAGKNLSKHYP